METKALLKVIEQADSVRETFRKSKDLYAIRQFLQEVPAAYPILFTPRFKKLVTSMMGAESWLVKSIYFDKPETSNWYVPYHQDLMISVDRKMDLPQFGPWTTKLNIFAVQPPLPYLENILTIRIHLDDTTEENGALWVVPQSHRKQIYRPETIDWTQESEVVCRVPKGGIMLMKPLSLHRSSRTTNGMQRRVIHLEFASMELPDGLNWAEKITLT